MKRITEFHTTDPVKLAWELPQLEDNVEQAIDAAVEDCVPRLLCPSFSSLGQQTIVGLQVDQQLSIDTSQASAIAVLPAISSANFGKRFVLVKRFTANLVFVTCQDPNAKHNDGAFPTINAAGVRVFYCDSRGYYS